MGYCEHGNELLGSIKFIEFLDFLDIFTPNIRTTQAVRNCNNFVPGTWRRAINDVRKKLKE